MDHLVDLTVLAVFYFCYWRRKWLRLSYSRRMLLLVCYIYLCGVLYFTLMPIISSLPHLFDHPYRPMNMLPFDDLISGRGSHPGLELVLNVLLMMPWGVLYPLLRGRKRHLLLSAAAASMLLSLCIELIQPFFSRYSDITDLITNTIGGILGCLLLILFRRRRGYAELTR